MNQIDQIKDILFSNEKRALDALTRRIEKRESRVADMADVLPESIGRSHADGDRLNKALRMPVEECLKDSINRDPKTFADALFPVIGPAIRKSIAETLKAFSESINQAIEEKTSVKSFKWRMQAKKAGIPYAQFLIQKNLEYQVDHAYLIQPNTGLLISDAHRTDAVRKDDDAISAMLTAIQDFVKESFGDEQEGTLETADIGKYTLWTMQGPHAMLACVINGVPPRGLRDELTEVLERIHLQYAEALESYDGTPNDKLNAIEPLLDDCLLQQAKDGEDSVAKKKGMGAFGIILLLGLAAALWFGWQKYQFQDKASKYVAALEQEPGIFITSSDIAKGRLQIKGLRDASAVKPEQLAASIGFAAEKLDLNLQPFHSLEKKIQQQRITSQITLPEGVELELSDDGVVIFSGAVSPEFKQMAEENLDGMLGVNQLDFGKIVYSDEKLLEKANELLNPPESVFMTVQDGTLKVQGEAPYAWRQTLENIDTQIEGLNSVEKSVLLVSEVNRIQQVHNALNNESIHFVWRTRLAEGEEDKLVNISAQLKEYGSQLEALQLEPEIVLTGFTDNTGTDTQNTELLLERALYIKGRLVGLGVRSNWLFVRAGEISGARGVVNEEQRKVSITLNLDRSLLEDVIK
ncbi:MAG: hypothetical protein HKN88_02680 [Gammaproteobacteria bacterium]|nr:hypothetical protein [Gammaproteobacteria bacterium]NNC96957.1 hypothetical protein [Gammaproteobacteria bacterium]NNM14573.1 hypothetical protein [Gammaproteobacteria bacterium]